MPGAVLGRERTMITETTYRAAFWTSLSDSMAGVVLTTPEESHLSDAELIDIAKKAADEIGMDISFGEILVGDYSVCCH